jgi:hypothetical protein
LAVQAPQEIQMGRVTAVYWPGQEAVAAALAELADRPWSWPGLPPAPQLPLRLVIVESARRFDSVTARRLPRWGAGAAFPEARTILIRLDGDPVRILRHELAHLALHQAVRRVPLWLDEGYAARAAGEWGRLDGLLMNWRLLAGTVPSLDEVTLGLRQGRQEAEVAYTFATTAVLYLERLGGARGLGPFLGNLAAEPDLDQALRATYGMTLVQFEAGWRRDLKGRYGWLLLFASFALLWLLVLLVVGVAWFYRRRRDRVRRSALDEGWVIPPDSDEPNP